MFFGSKDRMRVKKEACTCGVGKAWDTECRVFSVPHSFALAYSMGIKTFTRTNDKSERLCGI